MSVRKQRSASTTKSSTVNRGLVRPRPKELTRLTGVRAESLRAINMSLVLRGILAKPGDTTRAAIAADTGITRATISRLVDDLIDAGFVTELAPSGDNQRGRPAVRLTPAPGRIVALGLEINVSSLSAVLVDLTGTIIDREQIVEDNANSNPTAVVTTLAALSHELIERSLPQGALLLGSALALPGLVSPTALTLAPNLGWRDIPLDQLLKSLADFNPVVVANEADLAAFAVANPRPGVPSGPPTFIYVSGEVGIGAGLVINHAALGGASGWSGEIGHICADPLGPLCSCGASGCLEAYLGLRALAAQAGLPRNATAQDVLDAAAHGNPETLRALTEAGGALGRALSAVINSADIPLVLLGGRIAELADYLITPAMREITTRVLHNSWSQIRIETVKESSFHSSIGAAHRVIQQFVDHPVDYLPHDRW
ncbi:ROK family protein [Schaalia sp. ZJ405]|uniref:ROK family transcriptional regulator n=1 Tax=Schaalia sp. ZJ405 TaxID=2709403 RepID=UPI0013ECC0F1|nr:ROK family transcriptional regulator [Schaalia sp. ZJ405]QPK81305.1 ROK family protein [Schaalia sp. ZJ405]